MTVSGITDREFEKFRVFLYELAGISLAPSKKALVSGRLSKRLDHHGLNNFDSYFNRILSDKNERQVCLDLLTTNETYFFREPRHFDFLKQFAHDAGRTGKTFRVWSAASSTGEEPYSIAMTLADTLGTFPWEVFASDISTKVLEKARSGHYPMERINDLPKHYLHNYCLKGTGSQIGTFLIDRELRAKVTFEQVNVNAALPTNIGIFDIIFLRNIMIYFEMETKRQVVNRITQHLRPGGYLLIGHAETLNGITDNLKTVRPSIYQKP